MKGVLRSIKKFGLAEGLFLAACGVAGYVVVAKLSTKPAALPPPPSAPPPPKPANTTPETKAVQKAVATSIPSIPDAPGAVTSQPAHFASGMPPMQANADGSWSDESKVLAAVVAMPHTDLKQI